MPAEEAVALLRAGKREVGCLTYCWRSKGDGSYELTLLIKGASDVKMVVSIFPSAEALKMAEARSALQADGVRQPAGLAPAGGYRRD